MSKARPAVIDRFDPALHDGIDEPSQSNLRVPARLELHHGRGDRGSRTHEPQHHVVSRALADPAGRNAVHPDDVVIPHRQVVRVRHNIPHVVDRRIDRDARLHDAHRRPPTGRI